VATWLIATPVAVLVPRLIDFSPFTVRGGFVPIAAGAVLLAAMTAVAWWPRAGERVVAMAAALFAAWVALALQVALNGTPFGFSGMGGDMGRMAATVNRYTVAPWPTDTFVEGLPPEYPPLYPWLISRAALVAGEPAWRVLPVAEIVLTSFAVLAGYLMWRRLIPGGAALACGVGLLVFGYPQKAFAIVALFVFVPWLIATFTDPPRGRLHWLPAGLIGGLIVLTYHGWFPFGAFGVLAILVAAWRRADDRGRYLRHVLGVAAVAFVVASPYVVPFGYALLTRDSQPLGDLYQTSELLDNALPFLTPTLLGALQLVGLAGLVWYRQRTWWAWPLLYLVAGSYVFWALMGLRYVLTEHTLLIHYVPRLTGVALATAGVLTLVFAAPALARRLGVTAPYRFGAAALVVAMAWIGTVYWQDWRPRQTLGEAGDVIRPADYSTLAHLDALPDCSYPRYKPPDLGSGCLPVDRIMDAVESTRGEGARPVTLSFTEKLFAFQPLRGYAGVDRTSAGSLVNWDDRLAELTRLAAISDPREFATESANTRFGPIDAFVLARSGDDLEALGLRFHESQFDPATWRIVDDLDEPFVVAVRRP